VEPNREMIFAHLLNGMAKFDLALPDQIIERLVDYFIMVLSTTKSLNLISSKQDLSTQIMVHLLDSILPVNFFDFTDIKSLMDFGSGGGFPGIPLSLILTETNCTLIESTKKKARFLEGVRDELSIPNVEIINTFLEPGKNQTGLKFDLISARAVSELKTLVDISGPRLKTGGFFLAFKGPKADLEISAAVQALKKYRMNLVKRFDFILPIVDSSRSLLLFQKA